MALYALGDRIPTLAADAFVAETAAVIGDVALGALASVWPSAVLRGDTDPIRIGARSNLQDGAVVHVTAGSAPTTVGDDVTVGHLALLHGCTVGSRVLVGMGAIVLDHAVVGDESFVAAGSLVTPRTVIPPRSFVRGAPAKVVRAIRDEELAWILASSAAYVAYQTEHRTSLRRIG